MIATTQRLSRICCGHVRTLRYCPECGADLGDGGYRQGVVVVRMPAALHEALKAQAHAELMSLNCYCVGVLARSVEGEPSDAGVAERESSTS